MYNKKNSNIQIIVLNYMKKYEHLYEQLKISILVSKLVCKYNISLNYHKTIFIYNNYNIKNYIKKLL